ncbi:putative RNA polymerase sigma-70 region 3, RNA polymerase sigma-70 region 2 [Helianthus annuus]|nr:putative RNA polymerase sigma-70 region 3, RNA polymerase sigma-70 region 2 [Helianthus annuus]
MIWRVKALPLLKFLVRYFLAWELSPYLALLQGSARFSTRTSPTKRITIFAFKTNNTTLVESANLSVVDSSKENPKRLRQSKQPSERVHALSTVEAPYCSLDLDYHEAAVELDSLYKLSLATTENHDNRLKRGRKRISDEVKKVDIVRGQRKKFRRLTIENRIHLKNKKDVAVITSNQKRKPVKENEDEKINRLATLKVKEDLWEVLEREPTDGELAEAINMSTSQLRKLIAHGQAARNKLIKHNLRLVLFVMNKYFQEFANGRNFQDLCQAGVKGLITAIDRFEPGRKLQLSHTLYSGFDMPSYDNVVFIDHGNERRQPALLRLALDDVLDSLEPKESLVMKQRYGLDGKGNRTLGEIAGNLNISREMVRKHEKWLGSMK